ncbi:MAG: DmsE family decaheme c-type cytochrome [Acidobacteriota bacterium]
MEKTMRFHVIGGLALALLLGLPVRAVSQTTEKPPETSTQPSEKAVEPSAPAEAAASPACSDCHADQAKAFAANAHARGKVKKGEVPNTLCESCHGDGTAHIEGGGDKEKIYKPAGVEGANKTCLTCHDISTDRISRHAGMHANSATVNCLTCHSIHSSEPRAPHLLAKKQLTLCDSCHMTQVSSFRNKPYAHRLGRGGMECSSCHEPHGRPGAGSLRLTEAGELPCLNCHDEKRGPYVFQHGSFAIGDCLTCHEAHGSSNPKRLKRATVAQLCLECHSPISGTTLGSQPPSFHNLSSPRYQNCTTCHVAIHGSNRDPQLLK